ncbi:MAG: carbamoyltransferase HypF [Candidatus Altiarchaeota archaeon]|nr:carbamoyltransferase HypF [Candidatus Altiarchaeota archaeon]
MRQHLSIIRISGVVQGVGFRPSIYRIAKKIGLPGWVRNLGDAGVEVQLEGSKKEISEFIDILKKEKPVNSRIDDIKIEWKDSPAGFDDFKIIKSGGKGIEGITPADIALCDNCADEILNSKNRRHSYPFTTCTDCGPRFTTIRGIPYDRQNTAFAEFPPCRECEVEYSSPEDRRFHAQTIACGKCGPEYFLVDDKGKRIPDQIETSIKLLKKGKILIIKGIGGMHLACSTTDDAVIEELRKRLNRPQRPFAIMATLTMLEEFTRISAKEKELLLSKERPILVLKKRKESSLSQNLAPGLDTIGVMLPYTGLHEILFQGLEEPLVMTSANLPGEPMFIDNKEAAESKIADYHLLHNLGIENRCDDSVIKIVNNIGAFIRRSRGFVPLSISMKRESKEKILSLGAQENVTACLLKGNRAFLTQFIGDTDSPNTVEFLENSARHLLEITTSKPDRIACDLHPQFHTTRLAEKLAGEFNVPLVRVQHHYAHLASLMAESGADSMVGICCDGAGYGEDGNTWGGEIISCRNGEFTRPGHLKEQRMPGGDLAAYYPARMVLGILSETYSNNELKNIAIKNNLNFKHGEKEIDVVLQQLEKDVNVPVTTSTGRVLDSVAAILGLCHYRSYDGEPAMKLDSMGNGGQQLDFPISIKDGVLDTTKILAYALSLKEDGKAVEDIAFSAEAAIAEGLAKIAAKEAKKKGIEFIGISGGVAYNDVIVKRASEIVKNSGFRFIQHQEIPPGDGGISLGQAYFSAFYG